MADTKTKADEPIFWEESDGNVGWLCQWYYHPLRDDEDSERLFFTAEHYMMYQKAKLFGDDATAAEVLRTRAPRKAKALGRKVANLDQAVWEAKREAVVVRGNKLKFAAPAPGQTPAQPGAELSLHDRLLRTGDAELVEASPFDRVWGVGFRPDKAEANRACWGLNLLGKALMEVRAALREEGEKR